MHFICKIFISTSLSSNSYIVLLTIVNNGTFKNFPDDAIIETYGYIDGSGEHANNSRIELDLFYQVLMFQQNAEQKLVSQVRVDGDYDKLLKVMTLSKTAPSATITKLILDEYMKV